MKRKATCFFCYSWDNKDKYKILEFLKDEVERSSRNTVKVILDKANYKYNDDFDEKLEKIKSYDLIVPFFTPEFKSVVLIDGNNEREVKKEYKIIEECFKDEPDRIFPVVLSGTPENAIPSIFSRRNCPDISEMELYISQNNDEIMIPAKNKPLLNKFVSNLIGYAKLNFNKHSLEYQSAKESLEKLFHLTNTTKLPQSCLIKMDSYDKIMNQTCFFVIGRKGSGKSTFLQNLCTIDEKTFKDKYKKLSPIYADKLNLAHIFKVISKYKGDATEIPSKDLIILFWEIYFVLQCIYIIGIEEEEGHIEQSRRASRFRNIANKLKELLGLKTSDGQYLSFYRDSVPKQLSTTAIDMVDECFGDTAIDEANYENLIASVQGNLSAINILSKKFGVELLDDFALALDDCTRNIIISVDGFDKESERFRLQTQYLLNNDREEYRERLNFECEFYGQLLEVASGFKYEIYNDPLFKVIQDYLDFCIVLPKDRYDQIISLDRDSAKKQFCSLDWDEYELLQLITYRLEYVNKQKDSHFCPLDTKSLKERFNYALQNYSSDMPHSVYIDIDGRPMAFDLFNYILRLSFWRPRDIISNFASILSLCDSGENEIIDNELLKLTLKHSAREIIKDEFIKEYKNVFINLNEVLHAFDNCDLIMDARVFTQILSNLKFNATFSYEFNNTRDKLYILYQLGVIGLFFEDTSYKKLGYRHNYCYIYNEGLEPIERVMQKQDYTASNPKIIFNTIFIEYLSLTVNSKDLIGNFSWEYIDQSHKLKSAIRRF